MLSKGNNWDIRNSYCKSCTKSKYSEIYSRVLRDEIKVNPMINKCQEQLKIKQVAGTLLETI